MPLPILRLGADDGVCNTHRCYHGRGFGHLHPNLHLALHVLLCTNASFHIYVITTLQNQRNTVSLNVFHLFRVLTSTATVTTGWRGFSQRRHHLAEVDVPKVVWKHARAVEVSTRPFCRKHFAEKRLCNTLPACALLSPNLVASLHRACRKPSFRNNITKGLQASCSGLLYHPAIHDDTNTLAGI